MKTLLFLCSFALSTIYCFAQHTWDFEVSYLDKQDYASVQFAGFQLNGYQVGKMDVQNGNMYYGTQWYPNLYVWGDVYYTSAGTSGNIMLRLDGLLEIVGFDPNSDKLVLNYYGWNGASYDENMTKTITPIMNDENSTLKSIFVISSKNPMCLVKSINWYRNDILITDPASITNGVSSIVMSGTEEINSYNIAGQKIGEHSKGLIIKDGKKHIKK